MFFGFWYLSGYDLIIVAALVVTNVVTAYLLYRERRRWAGFQREINSNMALLEEQSRGIENLAKLVSDQADEGKIGHAEVMGIDHEPVLSSQAISEIRQRESIIMRQLILGDLNSLPQEARDSLQKELIGLQMQLIKTKSDDVVELAPNTRRPGRKRHKTDPFRLLPYQFSDQRRKKHNPETSWLIL